MNGFFFRPLSCLISFSWLNEQDLLVKIFRALSVFGLLSLKMKSRSVKLGSENLS